MDNTEFNCKEHNQVLFRSVLHYHIKNIHFSRNKKNVFPVFFSQSAVYAPLDIIYPEMQGKTHIYMHHHLLCYSEFNLRSHGYSSSPKSLVEVSQKLDPLIALFVT